MFTTKGMQGEILAPFNSKSENPITYLGGVNRKANINDKASSYRRPN